MYELGSEPSADAEPATSFLLHLPFSGAVRNIFPSPVCSANLLYLPKEMKTEELSSCRSCFSGLNGDTLTLRTHLFVLTFICGLGSGASKT